VNDNIFYVKTDFVRQLAEWYHREQMDLLEVAKSESWGPRYEVHKPFSMDRVTRHFKELIEKAFWASLRAEESRYHSFVLEYSRPHPASAREHSFYFNEPLQLNARVLSKLAPALEYKQTMIVWPTTARTHGQGELRIWGFAPRPGSWGLAPTERFSDPLLKVIGPGQIVFAVCAGIKAAITPQTAETVNEFNLRESSPFLYKVIPKTPDYFMVERSRKSDLEKIAITMRAHGHGGILLIVPNEGTSWKNSIDMKRLTFSPPHEGIKTLLKERDKLLMQFSDGRLLKSKELADVLDKVAQALDSIGQLTAIDGATLVKQDGTVLGFGAKIEIKAPDKSNPAGWGDPNKETKVRVWEPFEGHEPEPKPVCLKCGGETDTNPLRNSSLN
jgi:hypothetical protein